MTAAEHTSTGVLSLPGVAKGVAGGLAGGLVFGVLMQMMGMIGMIAMMVGSDSVVVGWLIHLAISAFIGATFALLVGRRIAGFGPGVLFGIGYGIVWWVLGGLIAMPAALGMPVFQINQTSLISLMGHMIFGAILGLTFAALNRRSA